MNKDILEQYAGIKKQIASLTEEAKELEPQVLDEMRQEGVQTAKMDFGTFSITRRTKWEYSQKYKDLEEKYDIVLKAAQKTEQEDGTATKIETESITFRAEGKGRNELRYD